MNKIFIVLICFGFGISHTLFAQYVRPLPNGFFPQTGGLIGFNRCNGNACFHSGADFAAPIGTQVRAIRDGIVDFSNEVNGFGGFSPSRPGGTVVIKHTDAQGRAFFVMYGHINRGNNIQRSGQRVLAGEIIGTIRDFQLGRNSVPHLHLEVYTNTSFPRSPMGYQDNPGGRGWHDPRPWLDANVGPMIDPSSVSLSSNFSITPIQNSNIVQGNTLQVRVSVTSSQAITRRFILAIHRFGDQNPLQDIGSQTVSIAARGTTNLDFRNISTNGFPPGQYQLYLKTEEGGGRFPAVGAGTNAPNPLTIWVVPNWQLASAITTSPSTLVRNSRASFTASVRNNGTQSWTGRFYLVLTNTSNSFIGILSGAPSATQTIGANQTANLRFDHSSITSSAGSYRLSLRFQNTGQNTLTTSAVMDLPTVPGTSSFSNPASIRIANPSLTFTAQQADEETSTTPSESVQEATLPADETSPLVQSQSEKSVLTIFPNPTNNAFTVEFELFERSDVVIKLYTQQGEEVRTLAARTFEAGKHQIESNGEGLRQGTYICTLQAGSQKLSKQIIFVK